MTPADDTSRQRVNIHSNAFCYLIQYFAVIFKDCLLKSRQSYHKYWTGSTKECNTQIKLLLNKQSDQGFISIPSLLNSSRHLDI